MTDRRLPDHQRVPACDYSCQVCPECNVVHHAESRICIRCFHKQMGWTEETR